MRWFDPRNRESNARVARVYAGFELLHTAVDFLAAGLFIVGSILFFSESTKTPGTWCFLAGSICFALKPTIRLARELRLASLRHVDRLADKAPEAPTNINDILRDDQADHDDDDTGGSRSDLRERDDGQHDREAADAPQVSTRGRSGPH